MKKGYLEKVTTKRLRCAFQTCVAEEAFDGVVPAAWVRFVDENGRNRYVCQRCARITIRNAVDAVERTMHFVAECSRCTNRASFDLLMRNENDLQGYTVRGLLADVEYRIVVPTRNPCSPSVSCQSAIRQAPGYRNRGTTP